MSYGANIRCISVKGGMRMRYKKIHGIKPTDERPSAFENTSDALKGISDEELIARFLHGDENAFAALMRRYEKKIYSFALSYVKNRHDAEDITQDTFLRAYRYLDTFSSRSTFNTWLHTIAKNLSLTFIEQEKKRTSSLAQGIQYDDSDDVSDPLESATDGVSAEDAVMKSDLYAHVMKEMEALQPEYREAIVLREVNGLSYDKISEILGVSIGTVKSRISRARNALRDAVKDRI